MNSSEQEKLVEIGKKIDVAVAQIDRGKRLDGQEVINNLRSKLRKAKEAG